MKKHNYNGLILIEIKNKIAYEIEKAINQPIKQIKTASDMQFIIFSIF